eukprot:1022040-Rhodomonas_salina.1
MIDIIQRRYCQVKRKFLGVGWRFLAFDFAGVQRMFSYRDRTHRTLPAHRSRGGIRRCLCSPAPSCSLVPSICSHANRVSDCSVILCQAEKEGSNGDEEATKWKRKRGGRRNREGRKRRRCAHPSSQVQFPFDSQLPWMEHLAAMQFLSVSDCIERAERHKLFPQDIA